MRFYSVAVPGGPVQDHFRGLFIDLDERTKITVEMAGGSGFGDSKSRDPEAIHRDNIDELSTPEGACEQYGWKMDPQGTKNSI